MLILVVVTTGMLSVYAYLALNDFQSDKIAYVFESNSSGSRSTANQIRSELTFVLEKLEVYLRGYNLETKSFHPFAQSQFQTETLIESVWTYHFDSQVGDYRFYTQIGKDNLGLLQSPAWQEYFLAVAKDAISNEVTIRIFDPNPTKWIVALKFQADMSERPSVIMGLVSKSSFVEAFSGATLFDSVLVNGKGEAIVSPINPNYLNDPTETQLAVQATLEKIKAPVGTYKYQSETSGGWLISVASIGLGDMKVISMLPEKTALEAIEALFVKSIILFLLLVSATVGISVLASRRLTRAIKSLFEATKKISQGDFNINVKVDSQDEIGGLANGFNHMAGEIKRLLDETAEKARMESELNTARLVQATLFPENQFENENISLRGFYEPASECGGDWWYFSQIGSKTYLWIGDATGHGVPAALVTSAAKSAASVLERFPDLKVSELMKLMNEAIYGTSKGQVLMTFFLGCFDSSNGTLTYSTASHDPPYLIPWKNGENVKKRDIVPLMEKVGARLGESPENQYEDVTIQIHPKDRIVFYTDGVPELKNSNDELWGERKFLKTLMNSYNKNHDLDISMQDLSEGIAEHRQDQPLEDDVTFFMIEYKKAS
ncbi:MAG: SpoIIE family protein phosphatase [Bdellovibrionales bacterium]|nr:SpoIIE family protein phosphatase [Bdellovibrionales bacterium]